MKRLMQYTLFLSLLLLGLYVFDSFMAGGRYFATISSKILALGANPHQMVNIKVDVVADSAFSQQEVILAAVSESFEQFQAAGINFTIDSFKVHPLPMGEEQKIAPKRPGHFTVILSGNPQTIKSDHEWLDVAGLAYPQKNLVIIALSTESLLNSARLVSTLQHELAHLFYVEHDDYASSYVMSPVANSSTTWSPAARAQLNKMRYRLL